jgi:hypothetical protein
MHVFFGLVAVIGFVAWALAQFLIGSPIGRAFGLITTIICAPIVWGVLFVLSWGTFEHSESQPSALIFLLATAGTAVLYWWIAKFRQHRRLVREQEWLSR